MKIQPVKRITAAGFTLIEMMVAIAITALLMLGLVEIFASNQAGYQLQQGMARLQENARFANFIMGRHLRNAGYFPIAETLNPNLDFGIAFNTAVLPPPIFTSQDGGGVASDQLEITYFANDDCFGQINPVLDGAGRPQMWRKEVSFSQAGNQLFMNCRYGNALTPPGGAPVQINNQPMMDGVEALQFQYGIDNDGDMVPNQYLDTPQFAPGVSTVSVRVGMIVSMPDEAAQTLDDQPINLLGVPYPAVNDRRIRRPLVFTIHLRNMTP
ncbi:MAG: hypothetical protein Tsb002_21730 [Wenzhouxiangellaceae bacterium]